MSAPAHPQGAAVITGEPPSLVLVVDDDDAVRAANVQTLALAGFSPIAVSDGASALAMIEPGFAGAVLTDIRMPGMDGLALRQRIHQVDPDIPVVLMTGHGDIAMAVQALRDGAFDFLAKPFATDLLAAAIGRALRTRGLVLDNRALLSRAATASEGPILGVSAAMNLLRDQVERVAASSFDVLIEGDTGTGKELVAATIHRHSARRTQPFVAVNCAALQEASAEIELFGHAADAVPGARFARQGLIERANRGTLFLDCVDDLSLPMQALLLRLAEEREILPVGAERPVLLDIRIMASTRRDIAALVAAGSFRADLYFRLNVVQLRVPPLADRREDIGVLFAHFAHEASRMLGKSGFVLDEHARRHLLTHDWPGNVRELKNFAQNIVLGLGAESDHATSARAPVGGTLSDRVAAHEAAIIREALATHHGQVMAVCRALGVPRKTLYDKLARHRIDPAFYRR